MFGSVGIAPRLVSGQGENWNQDLSECLSGSGLNLLFEIDKKE